MMTAIKTTAGVFAAAIIGLTNQAFVCAEPTATAEPARVKVAASGSGDSKQATRTSGDDAALNKAVQSEPKPQMAKVKEDLPNFHEVHPFLFRGGEPTEAGLEKVKEMGVGTIIDLRAPSEARSKGLMDEKIVANKLGFHYINLVMDSHAPTEEQVKETMAEIEKAKIATEKGEKNKKIFVHCAHGSDRTGCMIGIWRVTHEDWDYPTTYKEMRKYWFTPKFIRLSGAVEEYAGQAMKNKMPDSRPQ